MPKEQARCQRCGKVAGKKGVTPLEVDTMGGGVLRFNACQDCVKDLAILKGVRHVPQTQA